MTGGSNARGCQHQVAQHTQRRSHNNSSPPSSPNHRSNPSENTQVKASHKPIFVRRQWRRFALYRMRLSVRMRIHWGIGLFCFSFLASVFLVRKVLLHGILRRETRFVTEVRLGGVDARPLHSLACSLAERESRGSVVGGQGQQ